MDIKYFFIIFKFRFRQGFRRVFRFFFPCCVKCCSGGASTNTVRGRLGGLDDHTLAPQTATQYNNSCHEIQRNATSAGKSYLLNVLILIFNFTCNSLFLRKKTPLFWKRIFFSGFNTSSSINTINVPNKTRTYLNAKGCSNVTSTTSLTTAIVKSHNHVKR